MATLSKDSPFKGKKSAFKKDRIYLMLKESIQMNTREIQDKLNDSTKWGVTMTELSNLLARTPQFEKIGTVETWSSRDYGGAMFGDRMRVCVWGIKYES